MPTPSRWTFDRSWGDPMIATLLLLSFLLASQVLSRRHLPQPPSEQVGIAARLAEPSLMAPRVLRFRGRPFLKSTDWRKAMGRFSEPWDRALVVVLAREQEPPTGASLLSEELPLPAGRVLRFAYENGPSPTPQERTAALVGLGPTGAAQLLEARLLDREGSSGAAKRHLAWTALKRRGWILGGLGACLVGLGLGGLGFALYLALSRPGALPQLPVWNLGGRTTALVVLAWFSALLLSGTVIGLVAFPLPKAWRILGLPLAYGLHAAFGLYLLRGFSGATRADFRPPPNRSSWGRALTWALGFVGLAVITVFLVGLLMAPWTQKGPPPQKELLEALAAVRGLPATCLLFCTVAVLAPTFEEIFFRGFLLPWMAARWGRAWALAGTSLLFGAIHLVPTGFPALSALGLVLGLAFLRTADIRVCILVHGAWNGSVFLFTRWALG